MALPLTELSEAGVAITDEVVRCTEAKVIGGVTYYRGYLAYTVNSNIEGSDSATYGAWTAAAKGGTRKTVLLGPAMPTENTQVSIHRRAGYVYATETMTVYVRYLAHEPISYRAAGEVSVEYPGLLLTSAAVTIARIGPLPWPVKVGYVLVECLGGRPSADATVTISNGTAAENVTAVIDADSDAFKTELAAPFKALPGETITLSTTDGKGAFGLRIRLMDV